MTGQGRGTIFLEHAPRTEAAARHRLVRGGRSIPMVDGIATVDESGAAWSVALINRHPGKAVTCAVRIGGAPLDGRVPATVLSGDSPEAFNDIDRPDRVVPETLELPVVGGAVSLRPHSLTILRLSAR